MTALGDWREQYETHAESDRKRLDKQPVSTLLKRVAAGHLGDYFNIYYSIAERANPKEALPVLMKVLVRNEDYLQQYHCAVALLHLLGIESLADERYPLNSSAYDYTTANPNHIEARQRLMRMIDAEYQKLQ